MANSTHSVIAYFWLDDEFLALAVAYIYVCMRIYVCDETHGIE